VVYAICSAGDLFSRVRIVYRSAGVCSPALFFMSRIFEICKISKIRKIRLQVRKDLNVYST